MKYVAVFDIPDGYGFGCATVKACPDDGKVRFDNEFETVYADLIKMEDFCKPKTIEADFYRRLTLDHMEAAGYRKVIVDTLKPPKNVQMETVRINTTKGASGTRQRWAFYVGQLYLLDMIKEMQETYIGLSKGGKN